ncbi:hypothetical protein MB14_08910 [Roseivirga ehrenbergii]|uniref:Integrase catalytic domain-containing protein n=2 Tax=Roseivirga ehrenbergii (strain DSM 102268 / JCM 13514 / KCTC 12282 / NCIMB 14502 / KMM 6017) TaxID=279360 RepID=A0A150X0R0_ROSEK|nr:hypothetical protein MB14_08910 [Roseivirga ehrenbergii]
MVLEKRMDHPKLGGRKLYHLLSEDLDRLGLKMGRDAFFDTLSSHNLLIKKKRRKAVTTNSVHWFRKYPNLIKELPILGINQVWVSDITYWRVNGKFLYLCLITDAYSRKVMGYELSDNMEAINNLRALHMAITSAGVQLEGLVHHSDRGIQYCSHEYVQMLKSNQILISMTENGDPLENAIAERINGILKQEYLRNYTVENLEQARLFTTKAINLYNNERPHLSCGMETPQNVYQTNHKPEKLWKNYWKKTIVNQQQDLNPTVNLYQD